MSRASSRYAARPSATASLAALPGASGKRYLRSPASWASTAK